MIERFGLISERTRLRGNATPCYPRTTDGRHSGAPLDPECIMLKATLTTVLLLTTGAQAAEVKLWRLDCGAIKVKDLSLFSDTLQYQGLSRTLTDSCYLVKHGADLLLWDTGLPTGLLHAPFTDDPLSPTLDKTLAEQLAQIDVKPADIGRLGISHYHFDHLGQAAEFPTATLMIGALDFAALRTTPPPFGADPSQAAPWLTGGAPVDLVTGDRDVFGDGTVMILDMPGHTPGSLALLVRLAETGPVLLSGDVVHFAEQIGNHGVPTFNTDRAESLASLDRLTAMADTLDAKLIIQHDPADVAKLPIFPAAAQ